MDMKVNSSAAPQQVHQPVTNKQCSNPTCEKQNARLKKCAGCFTTFYCSRDCQRPDWKHHKVQCKGLATKYTESLRLKLLAPQSNIDNILDDHKNGRMTFDQAKEKCLEADNKSSEEFEFTCHDLESKVRSGHMARETFEDEMNKKVLSDPSERMKTTKDIQEKYNEFARYHGLDEIAVTDHVELYTLDLASQIGMSEEDVRKLLGT